MKASNLVNIARTWLGCKESNGTHKQIIDTYNAHTPLARGYKVKYTDAWCATFVSACAIKIGATSIIPTECSCNKMIELFKNLGEWVEDDSYIPNPGDIIFYDWDDNGKGDNKGSSDHVGIVESVDNNTITVIEGNYSNSVKRRYLAVNGKTIRGYGVPKYEPEKIVLVSANDITWELNHSFFPISDTKRFVEALEEAKQENSSLYWGYYKLVNRIK